VEEGLSQSLEEILESDQEISLVVQGGGMRGTYSIAVLNQLAGLGYSDRFKEIWATSAGALNSAYFLSKQTEVGITICTDHLSNKKFIDFRRPKKIIDIDYLVDEVLQDRVPLDVAAMEASITKLQIGVVDACSGQAEWMECRDRLPLFEKLRATAALPIVYGREVQLGDKFYVDGALANNLSVQQAISSGAKNVLVIMTKPYDFRPALPSRLERELAHRLAKAKKHSQGVFNYLGVFDQPLFESMEIISQGGIKDQGVRVWSISPSNKIVSRLTRNRDDLLRTAALAETDTMRQITLTPGRRKG
jgi:predicted patatin/cPLA2 family phospholipase